MDSSALYKKMKFLFGVKSLNENCSRESSLMDDWRLYYCCMKDFAYYSSLICYIFILKSINVLRFMI